jgi:hypothetical protein
LASIICSIDGMSSRGMIQPRRRARMNLLLVFLAAQMGGGSGICNTVDRPLARVVSVLGLRAAERRGGMTPRTSALASASASGT